LSSSLLKRGGWGLNSEAFIVINFVHIRALAVYFPCLSCYNKTIAETQRFVDIAGSITECYALYEQSE
jgi:hypothetical protein